MATYTSSLYNTGYYLKLDVNETGTSVTGNTSTLSWKLYIQTTNGYYFSKVRVGAKVTIDGTTVVNRTYASSSQYSCSAGGTVTIASGTTTAAHNANGEKSIAAGAITASCTSAGIVPNMSLASGTALNLTPIPRKSTITTSASSTVMGNVRTITITAASTSFRHTLTYSFNGKTGTIATKTSSTSVKWTVPTSLASALTDAKSGTGTITCETFNGSNSVGTSSTTFTATIPTSAFTLSASALNLGTALSITIARAASNLTHDLTYSFVNAGGTVGTGKGTSASWTPGYILAAQIPSATSGTCQITCTTKNGTATVGTSSKTLTLRVPNNSTTRPVISSIDTTPSSSLSSPFSTLYIKGYTAVKTVVTAAGAKVSGTSIASITSYTTTVDGVAKTGSTTTSNKLKSSGSVPVKVTVTDSRGFSTSQTKTISVYSYSPPAVIPKTGNTSVIAARSAQSGTLSKSGTYLHIECDRKITSLGGNNAGKIEYILKDAENQQIGSKTTLSAQSTAASGRNVTYTTSTAVVNDLTSTYTVQIIATDTFGNSTTYTVGIPTDEVTMDLRRYGMGIGIGQYAPSDTANGYKHLVIAPDWDVQGRVYGLGRLPRVISGGDINNYHIPGRYGVYSSDASSISNLPPGIEEGGVLTVASGNGSVGHDVEAQDGAYLIQNYRTWDGGAEWKRAITGHEGTWTYGGWTRLYPQPNAVSVPLTYVSNAVFTSLSGFSLYRSGVVCMLYVNAAPAAVAVSSFTTIGTIPEGARPNAAVVQNTNAQNSTSFVEVAIRLSTDGNIQLYSPGTQTSRIQMVIPYFTNL